MLKLRRLTPILLLSLVVLVTGRIAVWSGEYVTILHFNDLHGHLEPFERDGASVGGMARIAAAVKEVEDWNDDHDVVTLLLNAGDVLQGTAMSTMFRGEPDFMCLNMIGTDAMCLGNHEFDFGQKVLVDRIKQAVFPVLSANVMKRESGEPLAPPYYIIDPNGPQPIIVFGLTTADTPVTTARANVAGLEFLDPIETARQVVNGLQVRSDLSPRHFIIALTHLGFEADLELAKAVPEIDVIVGGHSHTVVERPVQVGKTLVVQAGEHGVYLGQLDLYIEGGDAVKHRGFLRPINDKIAPDPDIDKLVAHYAQQVEEQLGEVIATAAVPLEGEREASRSRETNLGNLLCDIVREYAQTDIALLNGGGIRAPINQGPVTAQDVLTVLPFGNDLIKVALTGAQVQQALERSAALPAGDGGFMQVSGVRFRIEAGKAVDIEVGGQALDPAGEYTVVTTDFLYTGGDGYVTFEAGKDPYPYRVRLSAVVIQAFREMGTIRAQVDGRIAR